MPTYEYRCTACRADFEEFQRMSDEPVAACPECGERAERRLSGGAGLLFKGSGFYITDYRSDSYKKAAGTDKGESGGKSAEGGTGGAGKATDKSSGSSSTSAPKSD